MPDMYYVSKVRYAPGNTHVEKLQVHKHYIKDGERRWNSSEPTELTRPQIVALIEQGSTFTTVTQNADKSWNVGAKLDIFPVETNYLKTVKDKTTRDNLENLPTF